jgi:hypothetical protein
LNLYAHLLDPLQSVMHIADRLVDLM